MAVRPVAGSGQVVLWLGLPISILAKEKEKSMLATIKAHARTAKQLSPGNIGGQKVGVPLRQKDLVGIIWKEPADIFCIQ